MTCQFCRRALPPGTLLGPDLPAWHCRNVPDDDAPGKMRHFLTCPACRHQPALALEGG